MGLRRKHGKHNGMEAKMQASEELEERLTWFGVWGLNPLGECECPQGTGMQVSRDGGARSGWRGGCGSVGKHPWPGFPHGLSDAVGWNEWQDAEPVVKAGGGRPATVLPDWLWVLDVDSEVGWRNLLALILAGAVPFENIIRTAKTRRGWHVYYAPDWAEGWRGRTAQGVVNHEIQKLGRKVSGLDVKTFGGYVVWPDGKERNWVPLGVFARSVEFGLGPGMRGRPKSSFGLARLGSDKPPREYAGDPGGDGGASSSMAQQAVAAMSEYVTGDQLERWQEQELAAMGLRMTNAPEGSRNVALNRCAFIEGRRCLSVGVPAQVVRAHLERWGLSLGLDPAEVRATVRSGLGLEA